MLWRSGGSRRQRSREAPSAVRARCTPPGNQAASAPPGQHCVFQAYPISRQLSAASCWTWPHVSSSEAAAWLLHLTRRPGCARCLSARAGVALVPLATFAVAAPAHAAQSQAAVSAVDSAVSALIDIVKVCCAATACPVVLAGCLTARMSAVQACTLLLCSGHGSAEQACTALWVYLTGVYSKRPPYAGRRKQRKVWR